MPNVTKLQKDMLQLIWDRHDELPLDFWTKYAKRVADTLRRKDLAAPYWNDEKHGYFWQLTEKGREVLGVEGIVAPLVNQPQPAPEVEPLKANMAAMLLLEAIQRFGDFMPE